MSLIDHFLNDSVIVTPYSHQGNGAPVYEKAHYRKCRIQTGLRVETTYKNPDGQIDQVIANAKIFVTGDIIPPASIVMHEDIEYIVVRCDVKRGFGPSHLEVYLM